jgi:3-hydroxybutyryl-CoA dehydratase
MDDISRLRSPERGYVLEELSVGMSATYARTVTETDLVLFAGVSGDSNPIHMNAVYAAKTRFGGRIVHGMLSAGYLSALLGSKLPGPGTIYLRQNLNFRHPVRIGDTVEAEITITDIVAEKARVSLKCLCRVGETVVIEGDALVIVPRAAEAP